MSDDAQSLPDELPVSGESDGELPLGEDADHASGARDGAGAASGDPPRSSGLPTIALRDEHAEGQPAPDALVPDPSSFRIGGARASRGGRRRARPPISRFPSTADATSTFGARGR